MTGDATSALVRATSQRKRTLHAAGLTAGTRPISVAIGDLNGDGKPDLAVANDTSSNVSILLGTGTGAFGSATDFAVGANPYSVAIGDLDGDGKPDLAVANTGSDNVSILINTTTDTTPPTITLTTPDGAVYTLNQVVNADYSCDDEVGGSGLASCVGDVPDGDPIDTATVGSKAFTVDAEDNTGNMASVTHDYTVAYDFDGFFPPVNNPPILNAMKAGQAVPVKFSLTGDQGLDIFAAGYPKSVQIACGTNPEVDGVESTVTAGSSGLSYDPVADQYTYVWKTDKGWAGTCRQLVVKLNDGTADRANFSVR